MRVQALDIDPHRRFYRLVDLTIVGMLIALPVAVVRRVARLFK